MKILSLVDASEFLKLDSDEIIRLVEAELIPAAMIGEVWVFIESDLTQYVRDQYLPGAKQKYALDPNMPTFNELVPHMLRMEEGKVRRHELSEKAFKITGYRLDKYITSFLGDIPINKIDYVILDDFVTMLTNLELQGVAINAYLVVIRKVLRYAQMTGLIPGLPTFPKVKAPRTPRGAFTISEYRKLLKTSWVLRGLPYPTECRIKRMRIIGAWQVEIVMPKEMTRLIGFMVNSFIRPSDIKFLQLKHIEIIQGTYPYLRLTLPETKKHDRPMVTMPAAVRIYLSLLKDMKARGYGKPNDYLFMPELPKRRDYVLRHFGFLFNWVLSESNLKIGSKGQKRSLYSLRHTAITFRLLYGQGLDVLTLARNARTSVIMVERFYASTLNGEMNIDLLHSKRKKNKNKLPHI